MSNLLLGNIVFFLVALTWALYLGQELFITGASALNRIASSNEEERKQVQVTTGLHFDGIEVWLIAALVLMLGAFPRVFAVTSTHLYIPLFLLLYALIARGVSIEVIYKLDNEKWVKTMVLAWTISSMLIMFILGIYITNMFLGYPYVGGEMTKSFASIFNVPGISGGLFFLALSLVSGAGYIYLTTEGLIGERVLGFVKKVGLIYMVPILLLLLVMGLNNHETSIFAGDLYQANWLFYIFPALLIIAAVSTMIFGYKEDGFKVFVSSVLVMVLFVATGFVGMFPNVLISLDNPLESLTIEDVMAQTASLRIIVIAIAVFYPIIIGYQSWKFVKFRHKIKLNDE